VLNAMLGGSNSGSLTSLLRDRNGVYDSGSFLQPFSSQGQIVGYVRADPLLWDNAKGKTRPVVDDLTGQLLGVFQGLGARGANENAVRTAREYVVGQYLQSHAHNRAYAGYLAWYEAVGRGAAYDQQFLARVQKVTAQEVTALARRLFKPGAEAVVVTLPRPRADE